MLVLLSLHAPSERLAVNVIHDAIHKDFMIVPFPGDDM
ncbi:hypothetical protein ambt_04810 [Alteromonas naphthalenivorans]|jgi:hypothetical protein|uniref:Uncharacterized protein n=1 Tax=Alteromonas naphthalenivorans TaxID=715451 RepID=F5ZCB9_ALTNA|nr:hypothetical protein ambt_04810 [Alteromonas naphthalenivorans]